MGDVVALVTDVVRLCKIIAARAQEAKEHKAICDALAGYLGCIEPIHDAVLGLPELADKRHIALSLAQLKKQLERAEELVQSCSQKSMLSLFVFSKKQELKDVEGAIQLYVGTLTAALAISIKYVSGSLLTPQHTPLAYVQMWQCPLLFLGLAVVSHSSQLRMPRMARCLSLSHGSPAGLASRVRSRAQPDSGSAHKHAGVVWSALSQTHGHRVGRRYALLGVGSS